MPSEELAQLVGADGAPCGSAPRSRMRAQNLRHAATAVLTRHPDGRIYVHRRTDTKDWAPGRWDAAAGGVVQAGEDPAAAALRELGEELSVTGTALTALGTHLYEDDSVRCFEYLFETSWSGPVRHQPEEVAQGGWMSMDELADLLADPRRPFVPDTRAALRVLAASGVHDYGMLRRGLDAGR